jgi:hypothetical protein
MKGFEIIRSILAEESDLTAREIAKRAQQFGEKWVRKDANSNLYRMLSQGLVTKNTESKIPTWSLTNSDTPKPSISFKEILDKPRKLERKSLNSLVQEEEFKINLSKFSIAFAYDVNASANDPYLQGDWLAEKLFITINTQHPFWDSFIDTEDEKVLYLQFIAQDAFIQWQIAQRGDSINHRELIALRDAVLREISHLNLISD